MDNYTQLFNLKDKVTVITGGAGILGKEFCKGILQFGGQVACLDVQKETLDSVVNELQENYGKDKITGFLCDIANPDSVNETIAKVVDHYSQIDILLNNAATKTNDLNSYFTPFVDYSLDVWRNVMSVNLDGMFLMAQAVGKQMIQQKKGVIVQTASIYSLMGPDPRIYSGSYYLGREINTPAVYTASKAGVIGLTKHLATIWAQFGIRVNALCPGGVTSGQNGEFHKKYSARIPMDRMAKEIDIVGPMLFLASQASDYMTGQVIFADGGLSAW